MVLGAGIDVILEYGIQEWEMDVLAEGNLRNQDVAVSQPEA